MGGRSSTTPRCSSSSHRSTFRFVGGRSGFDLIWYGVLYTITTQIAYMTPPFVYNLFPDAGHFAAPRSASGDIYRSIIPFVGVMIVALTLVMIFPRRIAASGSPQTVYGQ